MNALECVCRADCRLRSRRCVARCPARPPCSTLCLRRLPTTCCEEVRAHTYRHPIVIVEYLMSVRGRCSRPAHREAVAGGLRRHALQVFAQCGQPATMVRVVCQPVSRPPHCQATSAPHSMYNPLLTLVPSEDTFLVVTPGGGIERRCARVQRCNLTLLHSLALPN